MVRERNHGLMVLSMREIILMERNMVLVFSNGLMARNIMDNSKITILRVVVCTNGQMVVSMKVPGL